VSQGESPTAKEEWLMKLNVLLGIGAGYRALSASVERMGLWMDQPANLNKRCVSRNTFFVVSY
jgi:hypothetical protein